MFTKSDKIVSSMFMKIILLGSLPFMVNGAISISGNIYLSQGATPDFKDVKEVENMIGESFFTCNKEEKCKEVVDDATHEKSIRWKKMKALRNCDDIYNISKTSGVYKIQPDGSPPMVVYCDMTSNKGWLIIQRRIDGSISFNKSWLEYQNGFGDMKGNMWLGLENIQKLAGHGRGAKLRVEIRNLNAASQLGYAQYEKFEIAKEFDRYRLNVSDYSGTAGDAFGGINSNTTVKGMQFSTYDNKTNECAKKYPSGWWFNACFASNLNGKYPVGLSYEAKYISWATFLGYGNVIFSEMKISFN